MSEDCISASDSAANMLPALKLTCLKLNPSSYQLANSVDDNDGSAFDEQSFSVIKLNNGTALYLREVNKFLALVCILREENFNEKQGVIDYNFQCFKQAIKEVFELKNSRSMTGCESNGNLAYQ